MADLPQGDPEAAAALPDLADRVATLMLTDALGADLDLREVEGASELAHHLRRVFEAPYAPLLETLGDEAGERLAPVLRMLVEQTAAARADLFLLKTALQKDNRYLAGYDSAYSDPLVAARALMEDTGTETPLYRAAEVRLPFDSKILGSGWHAPQTDAEGRTYRWSSRARDVSVVLPVFGPGRHEITMDYKVLVPDQIREITLRLDGDEVAVEQSAQDDKSGTLTVVNEVAPGRSTAFQMLDISIAGPVRPSDYGLDDSRVVGLRTRGFDIAYAGHGG